MLRQTTELVGTTHQDLSHGIHDNQVPAIVDHLAAAHLSGPTAACSLAHTRWIAVTAQPKDPEKEVTHTGLAVDGIQLVKGAMAFSTPSPSGQVALQPTVVRSGSAKSPAIEECSVVDEQARVLKRMYLQDARARRTAKESTVPSCMSVAPHMVLCHGGAGTQMSWSSSRIFHNCGGSSCSSRCHSVGTGSFPMQRPSVLLAAHNRASQQIGRKAKFRATVQCTKVRAVVIR